MYFVHAFLADLAFCSYGILYGRVSAPPPFLGSSPHGPEMAHVRAIAPRSYLEVQFFVTTDGDILSKLIEPYRAMTCD